MARRSYYGYTTLAAAAAGRQFPNWDVTRAYVTACGGDPQEWLRRWRDTADRLNRSGEGNGDRSGERSPPHRPSPRRPPPRAARRPGVRPASVDPGRAGSLPELMSTLDELRRRAGLSLRQLADRSREEGGLGAESALARSTVSEFLQGTRPPRTRDVLRIAELCGATTPELQRWAVACRRLLWAAGEQEAGPSSGRRAAVVDAGNLGPSDDPYPPGGPTVLRLLLGTRLRTLREARRISTEQAGYVIRGSHSKISRMELGRVSLKERDVADLLSLYGVIDSAERASLLRLARQTNIPSWWQRYSDVLPGWLEVYLGLEEAASLLRVYELQFVPGLLQTEDYARAVIRLGYPTVSEEEVDRRVQVRTLRQRRVASGRRPADANAPRLWVILDEAILHRPIGDRRVMRRQVEHLIEVSEQPEICVQILPFGAGIYPTGGSFTILRFADTRLPDVVYLQQLVGATYLDRPNDIDRYMRVMEGVCVAAAPPASTGRILTGILDDL